MPLENVPKTVYDNFVTNLSIRKGSLEKVTLPAEPNIQYLKNTENQVVAKRINGEDGSVQFWINRAYKSGPLPPPDPLPNEFPTLSSLTPDTAVIGDADLTLQVNGTNFTDTSVIVFNGGEEPTEFVSDVLVTTIVKPSTATVEGAFPVLVRQGGYDTRPLSFTFTAATEPAELS